MKRITGKQSYQSSASVVEDRIAAPVTRKKIEKVVSKPIVSDHDPDEEGQLTLGGMKRNDVPCPRCGSASGSEVEPTHAADDGRHRGRTCNKCKYFFRTFEKYPEYDGPPYERRYDPDWLVERDAQCPRCKSREGSQVLKSYPTNFGRGRRRVGYCCGYFFETFEPYPKHEDANKDQAPIRHR